MSIAIAMTVAALMTVSRLGGVKLPMPQPVFSAGVGTLLRDGGFRGDVTEHEAGALRPVARERYLRWMLGA